MGKCCLHQCISEPTRINNILDLFLTNNTEIITEIKICNVNISDHNLVLVGTYISTKSVQRENPSQLDEKSFSSLNYHHSSVDWGLINRQLSEIDWSYCNDILPNEILNYIKSNLLKVCKNNIPVKRNFHRKSIIARYRRLLMRKRNILNKKIKNASPNSMVSLNGKFNAIDRP